MVCSESRSAYSAGSATVFEKLVIEHARFRVPQERVTTNLLVILLQRKESVNARKQHDYGNDDEVLLAARTDVKCTQGSGQNDVANLRRNLEPNHV